MPSLYPSSTLVDYDQTSSRKDEKRKRSQEQHTCKSRTPTSSLRLNYQNELRHNLLGVGSQFSSITSFPPQSSTAFWEPQDAKEICPYHADHQADFQPASIASHGLGPMDRYLSELPTDQYAVSYRNHVPSGHKECQCLDLAEGWTEVNGYGRLG